MAKKIVVDIEVKYQEAVKNLDEMQKAFAKVEAENEKLQKQVQKENKKTGESTKQLGSIADKATGGMISGFRGVVGSIGGVVKSLGTVRGAFIATGIGAFVLLVTSLISAFKSSEEGQDRFAKLMGRIGVVVGNVKDVVANLGEGLLNLGGALKKFFSGDFKGAFDEAKNSFNGFTESVKNFGKETAAELKLADEISSKIAKANKLERDLLVARAKASRDVASLRERAADKEGVVVEERIKLLKDAGAIEESITNREIQAAKLRYDAKVLQNSLSKSTKEDLDEEARLQAEVINLETNRLRLQKSLTAEITSARREAAAVREEEGVALQETQRIEFEKYIDLAQEQADAEVEISLEANKKIIEANKERGAILEEIERRVVQAKFTALNDIMSIANQESALYKAAYIARQILVLNEMRLDFLDLKSKAAKAAAIGNINSAEAGTELAKGAAKATATLNPLVIAAYAVSAAAVVASMVQAVKGVKKATAAYGGGGTAPSISVPSTSAPVVSTPPSFNVVGASGVNQLADVIAGQNSKPMRAYVVASDVSTAQSLERNIVKGASL